MFKRDREGMIDKEEGGGGSIKSCMWRVVCDKVVCNKVVCESRVCEQAVCERWCVTHNSVWKMVCHKDGLWQSCVWNMVCVTKLCVGDGVWQSCVRQSYVWKIVCDKVMYSRCYQVKADATKCHACHANSSGDNGAKRDASAPPEPAHCHKCHACYVECRSMLPSATPVRENQCHQVRPLPRK